jgi:hypothetical protein
MTRTGAPSRIPACSSLDPSPNYAPATLPKVQRVEGRKKR